MLCIYRVKKHGVHFCLNGHGGRCGLWKMLRCVVVDVVKGLWTQLKDNRGYIRIMDGFAVIVVVGTFCYLSWQLGRHFGYREALKGGRSCTFCHHTVEVLERKEAERQAEALRRMGFKVRWEAGQEDG